MLSTLSRRKSIDVVHQALMCADVRETLILYQSCQMKTTVLFEVLRPTDDRRVVSNVSKGGVRKVQLND